MRPPEATFCPRPMSILRLHPSSTMFGRDRDSEDEKEAFLQLEKHVEGGVQSGQVLGPSFSTWCLIVLAFIPWSILGWSWFYEKPSLGPFPTDLKAMHRAVQYESRKFPGGLRYDGDAQQVIWEVDPNGPQYFGLPSSKIDESWADLLRGEDRMQHMRGTTQY